eukprot:TRINITY_DN18844_c0_g1_i1.p1 TRINITY_DN18844_c0_g1~~TRINITY_DN18844_c0_g1_i1.p1  ORF type:complete len:223 (+),score=42.02 TRINITY_DN18844_c0_g1_i1:77-670(+)
MVTDLSRSLVIAFFVACRVSGFHEVSSHDQDSTLDVDEASANGATSVDDDFHAADVNGDGQLGEAEATELFEGVAGLPKGFRWASGDVNSDGVLSLAEVRNLAAGHVGDDDEFDGDHGPLHAALAEHVRENFDASDLDGSKFLESDEADALMVELYGDQNELQWAFFDADQDGKLSETELAYLTYDVPHAEMSVTDF